MKTVFIGVDISKEWLDVAICTDVTAPITEIFQVKNTIKDIGGMLKKCKKQSTDLWFCFEHTGNYGLLLAHLLDCAELRYTAVPALEIKNSIGITRGKTDSIDAARIALYAATHAHKLKPSQLPSAKLLQLKSKLSYRDQLANISRQFQNMLKSHRVSALVIDNKSIIKDLENQINRLKKTLQKLEAEILAFIHSEEALAKTFQRAVTVKGVGLLTAAHMLVVTNNFTSFVNGRKFNCYAGLAPFAHSSGSSIRGKTKTSKLRNRKMKALLINGANSAAIHDSELRQYFKRKTAEGKHKMVVLNAIACKLVYRIFAVVNRPEPYVELIR
jgi:transposase